MNLNSSSFSRASGNDLDYVVMQVTLKEKFLGTGSGNLTELKQWLMHKQLRDTDFILLQHPMVEVKDLWEEIEFKQL